MRLYSPSFDRKSCFCQSSVQARADYAIAYRYPATRTDACTSDENYLVRLDQQVCDVLQDAIIAGLDLLQRHCRCQEYVSLDTHESSVITRRL